MSQSKAKDPLDALQLLVNDVLVQTGKALRASRRDAKGNMAQASGTLQAKLPDTIAAFHSALDELESDIIRAKSVLLRDLKKAQAQNANSVQQQKQQKQQTAPQPIEAQSKSPMAIDIDSSPPPVIKEEAALGVVGSVAKPVAPFPDMGMGMDIQSVSQPITEVKKEEAPTISSESKPAPAALEAKPAAEPAPEQKAEVVKSDGAVGANTELNFTDMEFTLAAPSGTDDQTSANAGPEFDLTSFAPAGSGGDMLSLENLLPGGSGQPGGDAAATADGQGDVAAAAGGAQTDTKFDDIFGDESGAADGMDFDFSLDGGLGGDSFNDLMDDRDNNYDMMEHGDFDTAFFGLDKPEES